jgi:hypothetical protein
MCIIDHIEKCKRMNKRKTDYWYYFVSISILICIQNIDEKKNEYNQANQM